MNHRITQDKAATTTTTTKKKKIPYVHHTSIADSLERSVCVALLLHRTLQHHASLGTVVVHNATTELAVMAIQHRAR
jgi:hypothetical protein